CFAYSRRRLSVLLESYLPDRADGLTLLDVGCGTGHHMASMRERGFEVAGVDGSEEMLDQARANNPDADIQQSDVESIPFPDSSFGLIWGMGGVGYRPRSAPCIREMARVLRPGGVCLATATPVLSLNGYWVINRVSNLVSISNLVRLKQFFTTSWRLR